MDAICFLVFLIFEKPAKSLSVGKAPGSEAHVLGKVMQQSMLNSRIGLNPFPRARVLPAPTFSFSSNRFKYIFSQNVPTKEIIQTITKEQHSGKLSKRYCSFARCQKNTTLISNIPTENQPPCQGAPQCLPAETAQRSGTTTTAEKSRLV